MPREKSAPEITAGPAAVITDESDIGNKTTAADETPLILKAQSACVFDALKGIFIFENNADTRLPLASLTKLMTAVVATEFLPETALVEITPEALAEEGDSHLKTGDWWKLPDILDAMLISSLNDAAAAIADSLKKGLETDNSEFTGLMNQKAKELGLGLTYFLNPTGLDLSETEAGAFGSCRDVAKLMNYILVTHPELLEATTRESLTINNTVFKNTDQLIYLPMLMGGKTGYSDLAGGNLSIIVNKSFNHPIIITVLSSTFDGRFSDVEALYNKFVK